LVQGVKAMVESIVIICEESPIGKNSVIESIRMATGILAVGDIENCKVILMGDAIYFLNRDLNPEVLNTDNFSDIMRLIEFSEIEIYVTDDVLNIAGMDRSELIPYDNLKIVNMNEVSKLILEADMCFRY
jgi:sulfur relay (sulfurtransferase) DsrF/TusC family protein